MRRKKMTEKVKKTVVLGLAAALIVGCVGQRAVSNADTETTDGNAAAASEAASASSGTQEYSSERIGTNYTVTSAKYTFERLHGQRSIF